jgi:hypothetical protein
MYSENELLFPAQVIPQLRQSRGDEWQDLVDQVTRLPEDHPESLGFALMMVKLNGCLSCETDSYRAMKGCLSCARQVLHRHKGNDASLIQRYQRAVEEVSEYLDEMALPQVASRPERARAA